MPRSLAEFMEATARGRSPVRGETAIADLQRQWAAGGAAAQPFMDFIPIRLVTIIENSVRDVVARAVDHGQPYISRGLSLIAKFPAKAVADTLLALKEERITLGDLASHGFSTGRIEEIVAALIVIFGDGFRDELAAMRTLWAEDQGQDQPSIITDFNATIGTLDRLLRTRHVLVHELPQDKTYAEQDIPQFLSHATAFIAALQWLLIGKLHGPVPRTQLGMNEEAGQKMVETQAELDALRGGTSADFADPQSPLAELEHYWDRFSELSARLRAGYISEHPPGSIAPLLYATERTRLSRWRIEDINQRRSRPEGHL